MKKFLPFALLAVLLMAGSAAASVQNVKVSGDIDSTYLVRTKFDLGNTDQNDQQFRQKLFLTQTRLRIDADLTDNVSTTVGLINERAWGIEDTTNGANDLALNLAYVTLREMLYSPLTVTVGRQAYAFGNSFVIDSAGTNNSVATGGLKDVAEDLTKRNGRDAIRLTFDYNPLTIDVLAAKINAGNLAGAGAHQDDTDLVGANANWQIGDSMGTVVEGYFWAKVNQDSAVKNDTVYMPGIHAAANVLDGLNLSAEVAIQRGSKVISDTNQDRQALAAQLISKYQIPLEQTKEWSPVLTTSYTYYSGSKSSSPEEYKGWDPMFENQAGGKIYNTLFDATNSHIVGIKGSIKPLQDLTASLEWNGLWLAERLPDPDGNGNGTLEIGQPDGSSVEQIVTSDKKLGDEISLGLVYDYTEDVKLGATYGMFVPGSTFSKDNNRHATQMMLNANVAF